MELIHQVLCGVYIPHLGRRENRSMVAENKAVMLRGRGGNVRVRVDGVHVRDVHRVPLRPLLRLRACEAERLERERERRCGRRSPALPSVKHLEKLVLAPQAAVAGRPHLDGRGMHTQKDPPPPPPRKACSRLLVLSRILGHAT